MARTYRECADPLCDRPTTSQTGLCWFCRDDSYAVHVFSFPDGTAYGGPGGTVPNFEPRGIVKRWIAEGHGRPVLRPEVLAAFGVPDPTV
jgi:hypothetical protein